MATATTKNPLGTTIIDDEIKKAQDMAAASLLLSTSQQAGVKSAQQKAANAGAQTIINNAAQQAKPAAVSQNSKNLANTIQTTAQITAGQYQPPSTPQVSSTPSAVAGNTQRVQVDWSATPGTTSSTPAKSAQNLPSYSDPSGTTQERVPVNWSEDVNQIAGTPNVLVEETVEPDQSAMIARMIQEAAEAQRASRIAALDKAMQNALAALTNQEAGIQPRYYDARNLLAAQSDVNAYNFAQMMAGRGVQGAAAGLPEIYRNAALQGQLGTLERQKQAELDAIARDRAGVQTAYELDKANALADIESSTLQALINQMNADRQYGLQEAQLTGIYGGQPTLAYQQWQADQDYRNRSFEESVRQFDLNYGLDLKRLNLQEVQQQLDEKYRQGQLSLSQRNAALQEAELAFRRKQAEEEAAARAAQQAAQQQQNSNQAYSSYLQQAMNMLQGTYDSNRGSYVGQYSRDQVRSWVLALPLNSQQKADILNALGL